MKVICDETKCTGCLACVVACMDRHDPMGRADSLSRRVYRKTVNPSGYTHYVTDSCRRCRNAPCASVCPTGAITECADGWDGVDAEKCVGCGLCAAACPFGVLRPGADGRMLRCDGCGGEPRCVDICPNGALRVEE